MGGPLEIYQNRTRVRVCGLCLDDDRLLLLKHNSLGSRGYVWIPPGGGVEFGTDLVQNLIREFDEEAGLVIEAKEMLFVHEFMSKSLHALEIFFLVHRIGGQLRLGTDPELDPPDQILQEARFMSFSEINQVHPENKHQIFQYCKNSTELLSLRGYYVSQLEWILEPFGWQ